MLKCLSASSIFGIMLFCFQLSCEFVYAQSQELKDYRTQAITRKTMLEGLPVMQDALKVVKTPEDFFYLISPITLGQPLRSRFIVDNIDHFLSLNPSIEQINQLRGSANSIDHDFIILDSGLKVAKSPKDFIQLAGHDIKSAHVDELNRRASIIKQNLTTFTQAGATADDFTKLIHINMLQQDRHDLIKKGISSVKNKQDFLTLINFNSGLIPDLNKSRAWDIAQQDKKFVDQLIYENLDLFIEKGATTDDLIALQRQKYIHSKDGYKHFLDKGTKLAKNPTEFNQLIGSISHIPEAQEIIFGYPELYLHPMVGMHPKIEEIEYLFRLLDIGHSQEKLAFMYYRHRHLDDGEVKRLLELLREKNLITPMKLIEQDRKAYNELMGMLLDPKKRNWKKIKPLLNKHVGFYSSSMSHHIFSSIANSKDIDLLVGFAQYVDQLNETQLNDFFDHYGHYLAKIDQPQVEFKLIRAAGKKALNSYGPHFRYLLTKLHHPETELQLIEIFKRETDRVKLWNLLNELADLKPAPVPLIKKLLPLQEGLQYHEKAMVLVKQYNQLLAFKDDPMVQKVFSELSDLANQQVPREKIPTQKIYAKYPEVFGDKMPDDVLDFFYEKFAGHPSLLSDVVRVEAKFFAALPIEQGGLGYQERNLAERFGAEVAKQRDPRDYLKQLKANNQAALSNDVLLRLRSEGKIEPEGIGKKIDRAIQTRYYNPGTATKGQSKVSSIIACMMDKIVGSK